MNQDSPHASLVPAAQRGLRRLGRRNVAWGAVGAVLVMGSARVLVEFPQSDSVAYLAFVVMWVGVACFFSSLFAALAKFTLTATLRSSTWTPTVGGHVPLMVGPFHVADSFYLDDPALSVAGWTRPITKADLFGYQDPEVWVIRRGKRRLVVSPSGGSAPRYFHRIRISRIAAWIQRRTEEAPRGVIDVTDVSP